MCGVLGCRKEGHVNELVVIEFIAVADVRTACGGWGVHEVYCLTRGYIAFVRGDHQVYVNRMEEADKVEVWLRGSIGNKGRKGAILLRTVGPARRKREEVELLVELTRSQGDGDVQIGKGVEDMNEGTSSPMSGIRP